MMRIPWLTILLAAGALAVAPAHAATVDLFLNISGINGESKDDKHKDWIDVFSYSLGASLLNLAQGKHLNGSPAPP